MERITRRIVWNPLRCLKTSFGRSFSGADSIESLNILTCSESRDVHWDGVASTSCSSSDMVRSVSRRAVVNSLGGGEVEVDAAVDERNRLDLRDMLPMSGIFSMKGRISFVVSLFELKHESPIRYSGGLLRYLSAKAVDVVAITYFVALLLWQ